MDCFTHSVPTPIETGFEAHRQSFRPHSCSITVCGLPKVSLGYPDPQSDGKEHPAVTWAAGTHHSQHSAQGLHQQRLPMPRGCQGVLPPKPTAQSTCNTPSSASCHPPCHRAATSGLGVPVPRLQINLIRAGREQSRAGQQELASCVSLQCVYLYPNPDAASLCKGTERVQAGLSVQPRVTSV